MTSIIPKKHYIASCVFTTWHPNVSKKIQEYMESRHGFETVRCCMKNFNVAEYEAAMPEDVSAAWKALPVSADFDQPETTVCTICHNCANVISDLHRGAKNVSIWEMILSDDTFPYPDLDGKEFYIQDCWRSHGNVLEQDAVREILRRMNVTVKELPENRSDTKFCGRSYYKLKRIRKERQAPDGIDVTACQTEEEQAELMRKYVSDFALEKIPVITYCHYCNEGLVLGGAKTHHLAEQLFK